MNHDMDDALRKALRRTPAPSGFAAKVLEKAETPASRPVAMAARKSWLQRPFVLAMAATVAAVAIVPAILLDYEHREQVKGLKARQDLLTALAITRNQLQHAKEKVNRTARTSQ